MKFLLSEVKMFCGRYERHLSSFALVAGFIFDTLTLQRIDLLAENLVFLVYLVISGGGIILLNYYQDASSQKSFFVQTRNFLPFFIQFAFGGLFSGFFIFYTRSAALSSSWPFILILLALLVGNEFFRKYYQRLTFQVSIYFVAIFSFSIFFLPVILKTMGALVFVLSGVVSLLIIYLFSQLLSKVVSSRYFYEKLNLRNSVLAIFVLINILYFTNFIPPIPLALKSAGVYYSIERVGEYYRVVGEKQAWYESLPFLFSESVSLRSGAPLYVFSSVFAPTDLNTKIVHDWQFLDDANDEWISATKISFAIKGGRSEGYRGFSRKENLFPGKWRVDVKTERGQIIGRIRFDIVAESSQTVLEEKVL